MRRLSCFYAFLIFCAVFPVSPLSADTLTVQPATADVFLSEPQPTTNYGSHVDLLIQSVEAGNNRRSILNFDFTALPAGAVISSAILSLYLYSGDATGRTYVVYESGRTDWVEAEATWNIYSIGNNWASAGGDITGAAASNAIVPANNNWMDWDMTTMVQAFQGVSEIAYFHIRDSVENAAAPGTSSSFRSSNYVADTTKCPKLTITYTVSWAHKIFGIFPNKVMSVLKTTISKIMGR